MDVLIQGASAIGLAMALAFLVIGLFISPWPVLLLVLVIGLLISQRMMRQLSSSPASVAADPPSPQSSQTPSAQTQPSQPPPSPPGDTRLLHYRGSVYQQPGGTVAPSSSPMIVSGKYRGCTWKSAASDNSQDNSALQE